jgi:hypothetical protein
MTKRELEQRQRTYGALATIGVTYEQAETLRRASMTLHRWAELECGDSNDYAGWSVERDEKTNVPYLVTYPHTGKSHRRKVADREGGALKRIAAILKPLGLHFYHQTDPRGCVLYVSKEPLTDQNYSSRGIAIG